MLDKLIEEHYHELNENDLYIWQYILHHKQECQKMSIKDLAHECNVSHTSILRFTKKLGLEGFSELKVYLKWELSQKEEFKKSYIDDIYHEYIETMNKMKNENMLHIMEMIDEAQRIFVYGTGVVQNLMALDMNREFIYAHKVVHPIGTGNEIDAILNNITSQDLFIIISLSGNNDTAVTLVKALNGLHVKTIGIAKSGATLMSKYCNEMITFHCQSYPNGISDLKHVGTGHFFIISNFLFLKYLDYLNDKKNLQTQ